MASSPVARGTICKQLGRVGPGTVTTEAFHEKALYRESDSHAEALNVPNAAPTPRSLPEGYRFIRKGDAKAPFHCDHPLMGRYTLADFYRWSREPGALAVLRTVNRRVGVAALAYLREGHLFVEKVARDRRCPRGFGMPMILVLENLARAYGRREVRLEAINEELAARYETFGYKRHGVPYRDEEEPEWGVLISMRKFLR